MNAEMTKRTHCGWNNYGKMSRVLFNKKIPPHVKREIQKMNVQPYVLCGMHTLPMTGLVIETMLINLMRYQTYQIVAPCLLGRSVTNKTHRYNWPTHLLFPFNDPSFKRCMFLLNVSLFVVLVS